MDLHDSTGSALPPLPPPEEPHHCLHPATNLETLHQLSKVPSLFRYGDDRPPEATALSLDMFARATVVMSSIFLGPALLELATNAVAENCDYDETCIQEGRVYGFRPSSLLSNIAIASGLLGSISMPVFGAVVDHTDWRWQVGAYSSLGLVLVKGIEAAVSSSTWFLVAILQVVSSLLYNMHIATTLAYTSELSTDPHQQTQYNTYYSVVFYVSTILCLVWVTLSSSLLQQGDVGTARISQLSTSTIAAVFFYWAWKHFFRPCPALSRVPVGQTLWTVGFRKVGKTFQRILLELPALKWLQFAVLFGEAATATIGSIGTTYMKSFLQMDATEIGVVFLAVLLMGAPGSKLGGWVAAHFHGPIVSAMLCNSVLMVSTTVAAFTLTSPEHKHYTPLLGMVWGLCMGWLFPMHQTAFINLIPRGQQAEFMGIYILSGQLLSWMPPLLFTALNEAGLAMSWGLASMDLFYAIAIFCLGMAQGSSTNKGTNNIHGMGQYDVSPDYDELVELNKVASQDNLIQHRKNFQQIT